MPNYSKGKVYKIVVDTDEKYLPYVGSSCQTLCQRMAGHRATYKKWKGEKGKCASFDLFERFGVDKCKIILLEEYPCDSIMKLLMKEREWFDKIECCNQRRPFTNKEEKVECKKEQYQKALKKNINLCKEQYQKALEKNPNLHKDRYKNKETYDCDCGSIIDKRHQKKHNHTKKHQNYLSTL